MGVVVVCVIGQDTPNKKKTWRLSNGLSQNGDSDALKASFYCSILEGIYNMQT